MLNQLKNWCNKHITHERDTESDFGWRVVVHIPVGFLMGIPILGWGLVGLFIFYEHSEDFWTHDFAWKDVFGAMVGFAAASIFVVIITVIAVIMWVY